MINNNVELAPKENQDIYLLVSVDGDNEVVTELVNSILEEPKHLEQSPIKQPSSIQMSPPSTFIFHKKFCQLLLAATGLVSGFVLAYDIRNQQALEPRGVVAGFNLFASVLGLSWFNKSQLKKEKVDEEINLAPSR